MSCCYAVKLPLIENITVRKLKVKYFNYTRMHNHDKRCLCVQRASSRCSVDCVSPNHTRDVRNTRRWSRTFIIERVDPN